jgi:outer membrane immunogenic protein
MIRIALLAVAIAGTIGVQDGFAADMMVGKALAPPPPLPPALTWTGFYFGVHAGWGWTSKNTATVSSASPGTGLPPGAFFNPASLDVSSNGGIGGGQIGYNWQVNPVIVLGVEGDISGTGMRGTQTVSLSSSGFGGPPIANIGTATMTQGVGWLASLRGRIGYSFGPSMIYATAGGAWVGLKDSANSTTSQVGAGCCSFPATFSSTQTGWVVGAGYEAMLNPNWLLRGEYLFYRFDGTVGGTVGPSVTTTPPTCNGFACNATYSFFGRLDVNVVRVALSYKL